MQLKIIFFIFPMLFLDITPEKDIGNQEPARISSHLISKEKSPMILVGKWMLDGDIETYIDLRSDGTVIEKSIGEPMQRYWFVKNNKLCLKAEVSANEKICIDYVLKENTLTLTINKMKLHYIRLEDK